MDLTLENILSVMSMVMDAFAALVIVRWGALTLVDFLRFCRESIKNKTHSGSLAIMRNELGSYLLLGLECMVAADVLSSIINTTLEKLLLLGGLVVIRISITYFLNKEMGGKKIS